MHTRPKLSVEEGDLFAWKKAPSSAHKVMGASFPDMKSTKDGYYKPCDDKSYPPILAKYVVAFSVLVRAALGERASEDRLVYNNQGKIIGTISIQVPNFTPMLSASHKLPADPEQQKLGNPDKEMLLKKNVAELLISAYKHKNNDLHPGNISVNGLIDWDELYNELTSIIKGERFGSGYIIESPKQSCRYTEEDIRSFPKVSKRIHWPSHYKPLNWNLFKAYKTTAFHDLEKDPQFKKQTNKAILKELLAFDKKMLAKRMRLYLGEEKLDLDTLTREKSIALLNFGGKNKGFIEHCLHYLDKENQAFKHMVLNIPEFQSFLIKLNQTPEELLELKKWFLNQNSANTIPYNLSFIDNEYHDIWRKSFENTFDQYLISLESIITNSKMPNRDHTKKYEKQKITYDDLNNLILNFNKSEKTNPAKSYITVNEETQSKKELLDEAIYQLTQHQLFSLYDKILDAKNEYYSIKIQKIKLEHNHEFLNTLTSIVENHEKEQHQFKSWLDETIKTTRLENNRVLEATLASHAIKTKHLFDDLDEFNTKLKKTIIDFRMSNTTIHTPESPTSKIPSDYYIPKNDYTFINQDKTIAERLSRLLQIWISKPASQTAIKKSIDQALSEYDPRSKGWILGMAYGFFRKRTDKINNTLSLTQIFNEGEWNATSLNTLLIKHLCLTMLIEEQFNPFYPRILYDKVHLCDNRWWSKVALDIATKSHLKLDNTPATPLPIPPTTPGATIYR